MRIGVASIMQETNSFAARSCGLKDFTVTTGDASRDRVGGTNSEMAGAIAAIEAVGATAVPLLHAWALLSGAARSRSRDGNGSPCSILCRSGLPRSVVDA